MQIHTITITFGADDERGFDAQIDSIANQILCAGGFGVEVDHTAGTAERVPSRQDASGKWVPLTAKELEEQGR